MSYKDYVPSCAGKLFLGFGRVVALLVGGIGLPGAVTIKIKIALWNE